MRLCGCWPCQRNEEQGTGTYQYHPSAARAREPPTMNAAAARSDEESLARHPGTQMLLSSLTLSHSHMTHDILRLS
jgi:hypothetical protein